MDAKPLYCRFIIKYPKSITVKPKLILLIKKKLEIRSVERRICPIAKYTMSELFP